MRLETLYLLRAWLADATYGVNAQLASVPRIGSDALPANLALIAEAGHNKFAARRQVPDQSAQVPCLLLTAGRSDLDPHSHAGSVRDGSVEVGIAYFGREADTEVGIQEAEYRCRALQRAVDDWFTTSTGQANRTTGSITVWHIERPLAVVEPFAPLEDDLIGGEMTMTFRVRDAAP
jgi:hypothetical protein